MVEITLQLSEKLLEQAQEVSSANHTDVAAVLTQALESICLSLESLPDSNLYTPIAQLSDAAVLDLADIKMDVIQNQRLGDLQAEGKVRSLTPSEQYELLALMQIYRLGQLRKSEALAEAHQRGLRAPLHE
jgi:hypothetical protein